MILHEWCALRYVNHAVLGKKSRTFLTDSDKLNAAVVIWSSTVILESQNVIVLDHRNVSAVMKPLVLGAHNDNHM